MRSLIQRQLDRLGRAYGVDGSVVDQALQQFLKAQHQLTLREAVEGISDDLPAWVTTNKTTPALARLLDGQEPRVVGDTVVRGFGGYGDMFVTEVHTQHLVRMAEEVRRHVAEKRVAQFLAAGRRTYSYDPTDYGFGAQGSFVRVMKRVFGELLRQGFLTRDPTDSFGSAGSALRMPADHRRVRALEESEIGAIHAWIDMAYADPDLAHAVIDLVVLSGMRRGGLLALTLDAVRVRECVVVSGQKYGKIHARPVKRSVLRRVRDLGIARGAVEGSDLVMRRRNGKPLTGRVLDGLYTGLQQSGMLPAHLTVSSHWLRHTCINAIKTATGDIDLAGYWADHSPSTRGTTGVYVGYEVPIGKLRWAAEKAFGPLEDEPMEALQEGSWSHARIG